MKYLSLVLAVLLLSGCSLGRLEGPTDESYLVHTVEFHGETLGAIASWYTGKNSNWAEILEHNPAINVRSLQIGQQIRIPDSLVVRSSPLPENGLSQPGAIAVAHRGSNLNKSHIAQRRTPLSRVDRNSVNWEQVGDYIYPDELAK